MSCRKMVKKLLNIIKGWYYKIFDENRELAKERIAICNMCEHREHVEMVGDICAKCGCILEAKARVLDEKCKLNKW